MSDLNEIIASKGVRKYKAPKSHKATLLECVVCSKPLEIVSSEKVSYCTGFKQIVEQAQLVGSLISETVHNVPRFTQGRACRDCVRRLQHQRIGDKAVITVLADPFNDTGG